LQYSKSHSIIHAVVIAVQIHLKAAIDAASKTYFVDTNLNTYSELLFQLNVKLM